MNPAALLLAAGAARRFGSPKALFRHPAWQGQSMLEHRLAQLMPLYRQGVFSRISVVLGANADLLRPLLPASVQMIYCANWEQGQSASLVAGIQAQDESCPAVLVALLDQVLLAEEDYRALCRHWQSAPQQVCASIYDDGSYGAPVIWPRAYWPQLLQLSALKQDQGARSLLHTAPRRDLYLPRAGFDIDSHADLSSLSTQD